MHYVFFANDGRIRSGWRAAVFLSAYIFVVSILGIVAQMALEQANIHSSSGTSVGLIMNAVVALLPALLIGWMCSRYLEDLPYRSLGASLTRGWFKHFLLGLAMGAASLGTAAIIALTAGGLNFSLNSAPFNEIVVSLATSLVIFGGAAAFEEVLFRGYVLQTMARSGLAWFAIVVTAVFFGVVHMGNPNAGTISTVNTMLAGVWFGIAYLKTRDLWFVWGLHLMWNWLQGSIFGIEVSGITAVTSSPFFREIDRGPGWLTGLEYGIEGGIACTVAVIVSGIVIYRLPGLEPDPELLQMTSPTTGLT